MSKKDRRDRRALELERRGQRRLLVRAAGAERGAGRERHGALAAAAEHRGPGGERRAGRRRCGARGWRASCRSGGPRPRAWSRPRPARGPSSAAATAIASQALVPVTSRAVWIRSGVERGRLGVGPARGGRGPTRAPDPRGRGPWRTAMASAARGRVGDARVGDRVEVVTGDVGDGQVDHRRRQRRLRQAARP